MSLRERWRAFRRFDREAAVLRTMVRWSRGSVLLAALLAVGLQLVSLAFYVGVIVLAMVFGDDVGLPWLPVPVMVLAALAHLPVVVMAVPNRETWYAEMRSRLAAAGASPPQQRAFAWCGGAASFMTLPVTLTMVAIVVLEN